MSYNPYINEIQIKKVLEDGGKVEILPSEATKRWLELEFGMFIHFGINTFYDVEWSDGTLDIKGFNPKNIDTDQWCEAAKSAGMKYILFVTKHHDGFCNWHTKYTDYSIKNTSYGEDLLKKLSESCKKAGLKLGLYYSLWDRHEPSYNHDHGYAIYMKNQLSELLINYGEIIEIWFDGGWQKGGSHCHDSYRWYWREIYEHIKSIQPDCMVADNGTYDRPGEIVMWPCDLRIGEKQFPKEDDKKIWYCGGIGDYLPYEMCHTLSTGGTKQGLFSDGKWFWHPDDITVQSPDWIVKTLNQCIEKGANFVINAAPDTNGNLRSVDVECLKQVGELKKS